MTFIGKIQQLVASAPGVPWFLRRKNLGRFLESSALVFDSIGESCEQALRLSHPLLCDESALPVIARDRGLRLYATEPVASRRYRLSRAWQIKRGFGTHQGQLRNVQPFFLSHGALPTLRIVHSNGTSATWHTLAPDGTYSWSRKTPSNWDWDGLPAADGWSRYWLIIYTDQLGLAPQPLWDEGQLWNGSSFWDGLLTSDQLNDIIAGTLEARARHTKLAGVILATDPATFDPTAAVVTDPAGWTNLPAGNWGAAIDHDTGIPTRQPGASYIDLRQG